MISKIKDDNYMKPHKMNLYHYNFILNNISNIDYSFYISPNIIGYQKEVKLKSCTYKAIQVKDNSELFLLYDIVDYKLKPNTFKNKYKWIRNTNIISSEYPYDKIETLDELNKLIHNENELLTLYLNKTSLNNLKLHFPASIFELSSKTKQEDIISIFKSIPQTYYENNGWMIYVMNNQTQKIKLYYFSNINNYITLFYDGENFITYDKCNITHINIIIEKEFELSDNGEIIKLYQNKNVKIGKYFDKYKVIEESGDEVNSYVEVINYVLSFDIFNKINIKNFDLTYKSKIQIKLELMYQLSKYFNNTLNVILFECPFFYDSIQGLGYKILVEVSKNSDILYFHDIGKRNNLFIDTDYEKYPFCDKNLNINIFDTIIVSLINIKNINNIKRNINEIVKNKSTIICINKKDCVYNLEYDKVFEIEMEDIVENGQIYVIVVYKSII